LRYYLPPRELPPPELWELPPLLPPELREPPPPLLPLLLPPDLVAPPPELPVDGELYDFEGLE